MNIRDLEILNSFMAGRNVGQIARDYDVKHKAITRVLTKPDVKAAMQERLEKLAGRVVEFKENAFNGAEKGLKKLVEMLDDGTITDHNLKRLLSNDLIRVSGLEPRRRVLVENNSVNGIDEDTRDWFSQVLKEINGNVIDAAP